MTNKPPGPELTDAELNELGDTFDVEFTLAEEDDNDELAGLAQRSLRLLAEHAVMRERLALYERAELENDDSKVAETVTVDVELCVWCGKQTEGNYSIHRDGFGIGPDVPLCDEHGSTETPTCCEIWEHIARNKLRPFLVNGT